METPVQELWWAKSLPAIPSSLKECLRANGIGYAPFRDGQSPDPHASAPDEQQIKEDLASIGKITSHIRIYGTNAPYDGIPREAKEAGISVSQGVYLTKNREENKAAIEAAVKVAREGLVDSIIVGNEVLTTNTVSAQELVEYLKEVKRQLGPSKVPVSTAETWFVWKNNPDLIKYADFVLVHIHPFWDGQPIGTAASYTLDKYQTLKTQLRERAGRSDLQIVIGETGWPSAGNPRGAAVPGPENQRRFLEEFTRMACGQSVPFYFFDAFDEEWKWREGNSTWERTDDLPRASDYTFSGRWVGSSWGILRSSGILKSELTGLLDSPPPTSRAKRDILIQGKGLSLYYDIGVDSSEKRRDWLSGNDELRMAYPPGQQWGSVFITVGKPVPRPRPWKDFSEFRTILIDLKADKEGETVDIGVQQRADPGTGRERTVTKTLTTQYQTYPIPLSSLSSSHLSVPEDLKELYVVVEFVFHGPKAKRVDATNIRYQP